MGYCKYLNTQTLDSSGDLIKLVVVVVVLLDHWLPSWLSFSCALIQSTVSCPALCLSPGDGPCKYRSIWHNDVFSNETMCFNNVFLT